MFSSVEVSKLPSNKVRNDIFVFLARKLSSKGAFRNTQNNSYEKKVHSWVSDSFCLALDLFAICWIFLPHFWGLKVAKRSDPPVPSEEPKDDLPPPYDEIDKYSIVQINV